MQRRYVIVEKCLKGLVYIYMYVSLLLFRVAASHLSVCSAVNNDYSPSSLATGNQSQLVTQRPPVAQGPVMTNRPPVAQGPVMTNRPPMAQGPVMTNRPPVAQVTGVRSAKEGWSWVSTHGLEANISCPRKLYKASALCSFCVIRISTYTELNDQYSTYWIQLITIHSNV